MRKSAVFAVILLLFPLTGCGGRTENRVIQGGGGEVTEEMIATEEASLETTQ